MNRERAKELLPIVQALAEGRTVQFDSRCHDGWVDTNHIEAESDIKYRIKPEVKTITRWFNIYENGHPIVIGRENKDSCIENRNGSVVACVPVTISYYEGEGL